MIYQPITAHQEMQRYEHEELLLKDIALYVTHQVSWSMGVDIFEGGIDRPFLKEIASPHLAYIEPSNVIPFDPPYETTYQLTEKGKAAMQPTTALPDLTWLAEPEPKAPNDYALSRRQEAALIEMYRNEIPEAFLSPTAISIGAAHNQFFYRLERRALVECTERAMEGAKHKMYWKLTSAGRGTAINLSDLPF